MGKIKALATDQTYSNQRKEYPTMSDKSATKSEPNKLVHVKSLREFGNVKYNTTFKLEDYEDKPLRIMDADEQKSSNYTSVLMRCEDGDGNLITIPVYNVTFQTALMHAKKTGAFPITATFYKNEKTWDIR
jgi:hypothetical protein